MPERGVTVLLGLDSDQLGLSFVRGLVAAVNPCGFVLLPTYLMYFLGLEGASPGSQRASVRRALLVSAAVATGFITVFLVAGGVAELGTSWLTRNAKYVTVVLGIALIVLGAMMLFGYRLPIATPRIDGVIAGRHDRTVRSMFLYGMAYAVASIGCTIALFSATVFGPGSVADGLAHMLAYGAGMGLLVTALTVALAVANSSLLRVLRSGAHAIELLAAAFVLLSGVYLVYYFWVVDVNEDTDAVTGAVERFQNWVLGRLSDHWQTTAVVLIAVVAAAVVYVSGRRRTGVRSLVRRRRLRGS